jgi:hypothetical protein
MLRPATVVSLLTITVLVSFGEHVPVKPGDPKCGSSNEGPIAPRSDGKDRPCDTKAERKYKPRHKGIGFWQSGVPVVCCPA